MIRVFVIAPLFAAALATGALAAPVVKIDPASPQGAAIQVKIARLDSLIAQSRQPRWPSSMEGPATPYFGNPTMDTIRIRNGDSASGGGPYTYAISGERTFLSRGGPFGHSTYYTGPTSTSRSSHFRLRGLLRQRAHLASLLAPTPAQN